jgi:mono/diheme cytochrome c family protein
MLPVMRRPGVRVVALVVVVLIAACGAGRSRTATDASAGREIFFIHCYGCHTLGAAGTPIAPDLSRIGARLGRDELERRLRDPRTHQPSARMPRLDLSADEIRALAAYLSELR